MKPMLAAALAATLAAAAVPNASAREAYVLVRGADTVAVERFTSVASRLDGELVLPANGMRITYSVDYDVAGLPLVMHAATMRLADTSATPLLVADMRFRADSVIVTLQPGGVQAFETSHGSQPYLNPSMAMVARAVRRARASGADSVRVDLFTLAGGRTIVCSAVRQPGDSLSVRIMGIEMRFALGADGDLAGGAIPSQGIRIERGDAATGITFAPPDYSAPAGAPYTAEDVRVPGPGGITLAGTLTLPKGAAGPVPCVVTLTGSGLQDRDESLPILRGYRPFRQVADALARAGLATLRLDDRGYGSSGGDASRATTADFADDARAALAWLRARHDVDGAKLFLLGHSEGGIIAPMIAAEDRSLRGIVLLAAPSWTGRRVIEDQNRKAIARDPEWPVASRDSLLRVAMTQVDSLGRTVPWMRFFLAYDPIPAAKKVRCPVLVLQGETDQQVFPGQAAELATAMRKGGNRDVQLSMLAGLDHLFLPDASGDPGGYSALRDVEVPPAVLEAIASWVAARAK